QVFVNGSKVGADVLAPGWTDYRKHIVYQVYDVTSQLQVGEDAVGIILGDGWFASGLSWNQTRYNFGSPPVRVFLQVEIDYADGSRETIVSDESWKAAQSPIVASDLYNGETYDAGLEMAGWDRPSFSDIGWNPAVLAPAPTASLVAQNYQPIRVEQTLKPKA